MSPDAAALVSVGAAVVAACVVAASAFVVSVGSVLEPQAANDDAARIAASVVAKILFFILQNLPFDFIKITTFYVKYAQT